MPTEEVTLYERLGGERGIDALIDAFYDRLLKEPEMATIFHNAPVERIRRMQKEFFAASLDGPARYSGGTLFSVHAGLRISQRLFTNYVHVLLDTLRGMGVAPGDLNAVVDRIAVYSNDIVTAGGDAE